MTGISKISIIKNPIKIDLSCENLVGKYHGKKPTEKFLQMIFRVAKAYEPSIIILRDAEIGFMKKPPKKDARDPKRLKKALPKVNDRREKLLWSRRGKQFGSEDRISRNPD